MEPTEVKDSIIEHIAKHGATSIADIIILIAGATERRVRAAIVTLKRNESIVLIDGKYALPINNLQRRINSKPWDSRLFA